MKQNFFYSSILFLVLLLFQGSIYDVQIISVQNSTISISSFANKKILITTINCENPNTAQLLFLDSLQNTDTSLRVIVVPALDFGGIEHDAALVSLSNTLGLDFTIIRSAFVKKAAGNNQHPLFRWLTDVNENWHFNTDVESIGQFFIVSKTGNLYSVLSNDVSREILNQVLNQNIVQ